MGMVVLYLPWRNVDMSRYVVCPAQVTFKSLLSHFQVTLKSLQYRLDPAHPKLFWNIPKQLKAYTVNFYMLDLTLCKLLPIMQVRVGPISKLDVGVT